MIHIKKKLCFILLAGMISVAQAEEKTRLLLDLGFDFGGETLMELYYDDGSSTKIKSHEGVFFDIGAMIPLEDFDIQATLGYKMGTAQAKNGEADFTRIPIEALALYRTGPHRIGGGILYHLNPEFSCNISGICNGSVEFDNATGFALEYSFTLESPTTPGDVIFGFRYQSLSYTPSVGGGSIDASGVGFRLGVMY